MDTEQKKVIVLSALYGVTDILINNLTPEKLNENNINKIICKIKNIHYKIINEFFDSQEESKEVIKIFKPYLNKLKKLDFEKLSA